MRRRASSPGTTYDGVFTVADVGGLLLQGQWTVSLPRDVQPGDTVRVTWDPALVGSTERCGCRGRLGENEPAPCPLLADGPAPWRLVGETAATLQLTKPLAPADGTPRGTLDLVLSKATGRLTITVSMDDRSSPGAWRSLVLRGGPDG